MKAAVCTRPPELIRNRGRANPVPKDHEVLIKVLAASVNPQEPGMVKGGGRIVNGLRKLKDPRLGVDVTGELEAVGRNVTQLKQGDEVFGACIKYPRFRC